MTQEEKLQRLLEMQEHPERYTEEEIHQLMTDEECRQLYEQMVRATDAIFSEKVTAKETTAIAQQRRWIQVAAVFIGVLMLSGIAYAAIHIISNVGGNMKSPTQEARVSIQQPQRQNQATEEITDSIPQTRIFENVPLDEMVSELASYYNKVADVQNAQAHDLRLYYKWKLKDKIEDVMDDLNHFDHVNLVLEDDKLIVKP
jgi:ferric-dicitrate binding protein FerR (iron transport regulator)